MDNISKLLQYIVPFSKVSIECDGKIHDKATNSIKLSSSFFYVDRCNSCGCCCPPESNVYTVSDKDRIDSVTDEFLTDYGLDPEFMHMFKQALIEETHSINGHDVHVWVYKLVKNEMYLPQKGKSIFRCSQLFEHPMGYRCKIHPVRSITCITPHLRVFHNKTGNVSLGISQFGRNWALNCPVVFSEASNYEEWNSAKQDRLFKLERILEAANDFGVETYIPDVLNYIQNIDYENYREYLNKNIIDTIKVRKLF